MLYLSAAFDNVDHSILLNRLENRLGIRGNALNWFKSYLSDRSQCVLINGAKSSHKKLQSGVPQGSVLGPILFNIYTIPLGDILRKHFMPYHFYADDSQKHAFFELQNYHRTINKMETVAKDIRMWYSENLLMRNDAKTEVIVLSSKFSPISSLVPLTVGDWNVDPVPHVKNLGVIFDDNLDMTKHVDHTVRAAFFELRKIAFYRREPASLIIYLLF